MPIAGSSAGSEDFTPALMEELGELLVHGITVMPGKPALLAAVDTSPSIPAAAQALSLDFVHVACERYDLVIPSAYLGDEKILLLLDIIRSDKFKEKALAMRGYEVHETVNVVDQI